MMDASPILLHIFLRQVSRPNVQPYGIQPHGVTGMLGELDCFTALLMPILDSKLSIFTYSAAV